jgi:hypothetical protein
VERPSLLLDVAAEGTHEASRLATWVDYRTTRNWPGCKVFIALERPGQWVPFFWTAKKHHELSEEFTEVEYPLDASLLPFFPRRMLGYCRWEPRSFELRFEPGDLSNPESFGKGAAPPSYSVLNVSLVEPEEIGPEANLVPEGGLSLELECGRHVETWSYRVTPEGEITDVEEITRVNCRVFDSNGDLVAESYPPPAPPAAVEVASPSEESYGAPVRIPMPEVTLPDHLSYVWPRGESLPPIEILIVDTL